MFHIEMRRVNKWYGELHVLRDINLKVTPGERIVLCGPAGSGKSTMLRCINRLEEYQQGSIFIDGVELTDNRKTIQQIRRDLGIVFQEGNLFSHLTVLENCMLAPLWVKKMPKRDARALAMHYLRRVKVAEHANEYPGQLTGGQQQRAALARALCMTPKILLVDEPAANLAPELQEELFDTIVSLAEEDMTMLCVTHDMGFARQIANRVLFLNGGRISEIHEPQRFVDGAERERNRPYVSQLYH